MRGFRVAGSVISAVLVLGLLARWTATEPSEQAASSVSWWISASRRTIGLLLGTTVVALTLGVPLGVASGVSRTEGEGGLSRALEFAGRVPSILLVGALRFWDPTGGVLALAGTLSVLRTLEVARVVRSHVILQASSPFVEASRAIGGTGLWRLRTHVLPGLGRPLLATIALGVSASLGLEAALSFVGLGMPATFAVWGGGLGEFGQLSPPATIWPAGLSIALTCFAFRSFAEQVSRIAH